MDDVKIVDRYKVELWDKEETGRDIILVEVRRNGTGVNRVVVEGLTEEILQRHGIEGTSKIRVASQIVPSQKIEIDARYVLLDRDYLKGVSSLVLYSHPRKRIEDILLVMEVPLHHIEVFFSRTFEPKKSQIEELEEMLEKVNEELDRTLEHLRDVRRRMHETDNESVLEDLRSLEAHILGKVEELEKTKENIEKQLRTVKRFLQ